MMQTGATMEYCNGNNQVFLGHLMDKKRDELFACLPDEVMVTLQFADGDKSFCAEVPEDFKLRYLDDQIEGLYLPDAGSDTRLPFLDYANAGDLRVLAMQQSLTPAAKCAYVSSLNQMTDCIYLAYFADHAFENWLLLQSDFYDTAVHQYMSECREEADYDYEM